MLFSFIETGYKHLIAKFPERVNFVIQLIKSDLLPRLNEKAAIIVTNPVNYPVWQTIQ